MNRYSEIFNELSIPEIVDPLPKEGGIFEACFKTNEDGVLVKSWKRVGFVYVIANTLFNSIYKIGFSKNFDKRFEALKISCHEDSLKVRFLFYPSKDESLRSGESKLHRLFKHKRKKGEWFELEGSDLELLKDCMLKHNWKISEYETR